MVYLEKKIDALMRLAVAETPEDKERARQALLSLKRKGEDAAAQTDPESIVRQILLDIGAPDHLTGYRYILRGVLLMIEDPKQTLFTKLYAEICKEFGTTASKADRAVRHVIETVWKNGDIDVLNHYFGNTVDPNKGKPTINLFMARLRNVTVQRMESMR